MQNVTSLSRHLSSDIKHHLDVYAVYIASQFYFELREVFW